MGNKTSGNKIIYYPPVYSDGAKADLSKFVKVIPLGADTIHDFYPLDTNRILYKWENKIGILKWSDLGWLMHTDSMKLAVRNCYASSDINNSIVLFSGFTYSSGALFCPIYTFVTLTKLSAKGKSF